MFKYEVEYEDYDGNQKSRVLYFNLDKDELLRLQVSGAKITEDGIEGGMADQIKAVVESGDAEKIFEFLEWTIEKSYGEREGDLLVKDEKAWHRFRYSRAYTEFLWTLFSDSSLSAEFVQKTFPKGIVDEFNKSEEGQDLLERMKTRTDEINKQ